MYNLKLHNQAVTLVDQVEDSLLNYFREHDLRIGDSIPNELDLAAALGVARSVLREALSRLKMMGMIETRTRKGMILTEPSILGGMKRVVDPRILSEDSLFDILGFRIALEIGICSDLFRNITPEDIVELEEIVRLGIVFENNEYAPISEFTFHAKLYEITGNKTIRDVEMKKNGDLVTHADLLEYIKKNDEAGYRDALERHFAVYKIFMSEREKLKESHDMDSV